eukprot:366028-Chlamydomonas_euryale.AAC.42
MPCFNPGFASHRRRDHVLAMSCCSWSSAMMSFRILTRPRDQTSCIFAITDSELQQQLPLLRCASHALLVVLWTWIVIHACARTRTDTPACTDLHSRLNKLLARGRGKFRCEAGAAFVAIVVGGTATRCRHTDVRTCRNRRMATERACKAARGGGVHVAHGRFAVYRAFRLGLRSKCPPQSWQKDAWNAVCRRRMKSVSQGMLARVGF